MAHQTFILDFPVEYQVVFIFPPKPYKQPPPFFATYTYAGFIFNFFERSDPLETVVVFKFLQMPSNFDNFILLALLSPLQSQRECAVEG